MPKSKQPAHPKIPSTGPLTLKQARALAQAGTQLPAARRRAPGRAPRRSPVFIAPTASSLPESMGAERKSRELAHADEDKRRVRDYKATLTLLKQRGVKGLPAAAPSRRGPRRAPGAPGVVTGGPLQVFAEGDSWFDYPVPLFGGGVIPRLEDLLGVPILNMAKAGDEVRFMLGVKQRQQLAKRLQEGCPAGGPWDALLFSGGGNDIVDNPMALWIRDYATGVPPAQLIHQARYDTALALVRAGYEDLIALRNQLSPATHLVFQGYDYAIPDGRGVCHLGPWLKPTLDLRGFPMTGNVRFEVVKAMLSQFAQMLNTLATGNSNIMVVQTQGTLRVQKNSWHNELHPSKAGFESIAKVFHQALKTIFPARVL